MRRHLATLLAVVALFAQQNLIPVVSFATGADLSYCGHAPVEVQHHGGDRQDPGDADHAGPCHFCRIVGAALPPPPVTVLGLVEPSRVVFIHDASESAASIWQHDAHRVRGPPLPSDLQSKIAVS